MIVGFLHTAEVHVATFSRLLEEEAPGSVGLHAVDVGLLDRARREGPGAVRAGTAERLRDLVAEGAEVVLCTCSTVGGTAETLGAEVGVPVLRVDRAMARAAAEVAGHRSGPVLVVAALTSTMAPTEALLVEEGAEAVTTVLVREEGWAAFERGDQDTYLAVVVDAVREAAAAHGPSVVVLAQASAADAAGRLDDLGVPVLASPRLGVRAAVAAGETAAQPEAPRR